MGRGSGSPASPRQENINRLLWVLRERGPMTQSELARMTSLSRATVSNLVRKLAEQQQVLVRPTKRGGRQANEVSLSAGPQVVVGIDVGHRHIRAAVCDFGHAILAEAAEPLPPNHSSDQGLALAERLVGAALRQAGVDRREVVCAGLGLPAPIDSRSGRVGSSSILPGWIGIQAAQSLKERLGIEVRVDNDANLGALAEMIWGQGRGFSDFVYIKASTGIGAGLIIRGALYRGAFGAAGEVGHTTIDESGPLCRCGNRGCLETFAGAAVLLDVLRPTYGRMSISRAIVLARQGDQRCRRVLADAGQSIGLAMANLCVTLNPECLILGGELATAGDILLDPLRAAVARLAVSSAAETKILQGSLGDRAQVLGATALAMEVPEQASRDGSPLRDDVLTTLSR
jgi:predicted NBD/HSP70 family sugar kinase